MRKPISLYTSITVSLLANFAFAAEPDYRRGQQLLDHYLRQQVQDISGHCLSDIKSRADWEKQRPELRRQFLDMLGLWPLPPRTDLHPVVTGKLVTERFTVEKLHFQSSPGLYVTANLYVPEPAGGPRPATGRPSPRSPSGLATRRWRPPDESASWRYAAKRLRSSSLPCSPPL